MSECENQRVKVVYLDGDHVNVISGLLIEDNGEFITLDLDKYRVKINLAHVYKMEVSK